MTRLLAVALLLAAVALILFSVVGDGAEAAPLISAASEPIHDAPRGPVATELLPYKVPEAHERKYDKQHRPYQLLVRVLRFADLEPLDVDPARLVIPGAREIRRVDTGTYLVEGLAMALLPVNLLDESGDGAVRAPGSTPVYVASRNPVVLARHAVTTCDLIVLGPDDATEVVELRGVVADRFTGERLDGVYVIRPDETYVVTDEDGRFEFEEPGTVANLFGLHFVLDGYVPVGVSHLTISRPWLEHLRDTGEALFTLRPEAPR